MGNKDGIKIIEKDYEILKTSFHKLKFIKGVAVYFDPTASERRIREGQNNFSIVTEDGIFIMDKSKMLLERFYKYIEINEYGLFKLEHASPNFGLVFSGSLMSSYIFDFEGNYLTDSDFNTVIKILSNRIKCYSPSDFIKMPFELETGRFAIIDRYSLAWTTKTGVVSLEFDKEYDNGLKYTVEESRTGPDRYIELEYVQDKYNNKMYLNEFYYGILMLNNGKIYLNELARQFKQDSIDLLKPEFSSDI